MGKIDNIITELRKCKSLKDMSDASWLILRNGVSDFSWQDWCRQLSDEIYIAHEQDMADYAREMFPINVTSDAMDVGQASIDAFQRECVRHDMVERLRSMVLTSYNSYDVVNGLYKAIVNPITAEPRDTGNMYHEIRKALVEVLAKNELESAPIEDECEDYEPSADPITGELRSAMVKDPECEGLYMLEKVEFDRLCDAVNAVCANMAEEVKDARSRQIDENIASHREVCAALQNIKSMSGPYRNMVNNYDSVRASRDRWKAKAKKAERQADLMEQMLRDVRDELNARDAIATIECDPYVTDANGERLHIGDVVKSIEYGYIESITAFLYDKDKWLVKCRGCDPVNSADVSVRFEDSIESIIESALRVPDGYTDGNRDVFLARARKLAGGVDD